MKICPAIRIQSVNGTSHVGLSIQQKTKKQGQNDCYEKGAGLTLAVGWEDSELFPDGFSLKLLLAGETFIPCYWMEFQSISSFFLGFH